MALTKCRECKHDISKSAKTCPNCGVSRPVGGNSWFTMAVAGVLVLVAFRMCSHALSSDKTAGKSVPVSAPIVAASTVAATPAVAPTPAVPAGPSFTMLETLARAGTPLECVQVTLNSAKTPLKKGETIDGVLAGFQKKISKNATKRVLYANVDACPIDGVLSTCTLFAAFGTMTTTAYDVDIALSEKRACEEGKGTFTATDAMAKAVADRPVKVSAAALLTAYQANEVAADNKYKKRKLAVTGTVAAISKDVFDHAFLSLASSNQFESVTAKGLDPIKLAEMNKGDSVSLICTGAGMVIGAPILDDCVLAP
ncbi:MAG: hypothetical protein ABI548_04660 [Polyangiaceae bacterium]